MTAFLSFNFGRSVISSLQNDMYKMVLLKSIIANHKSGEMFKGIVLPKMNIHSLFTHPQGLFILLNSKEDISRKLKTLNH